MSNRIPNPLKSPDHDRSLNRLPRAIAWTSILAAVGGAVINLLATNVGTSGFLGDMYATFAKLFSGLPLGLGIAVGVGSLLVASGLARLVASKRRTEESKQAILKAAHSYFLSAEPQSGQSIIVESRPSSGGNEPRAALDTWREISIGSVRNLRHNSLNLGDDFAADFPYVGERFEELVASARRKSHELVSGHSRSKGWLILGQSNSGKSRLAFEITKQVFPEWSYVVWTSAMPPLDQASIESIKGNSVALILDGLDELSVRPDQGDDEYLSLVASYAGLAFELRRMLYLIERNASKSVIIATCRENALRSTTAMLDWLISDLEVVNIPRFNTKYEERAILKAFSRVGAPYLEDWDGTVGSLVLGLSAKGEVYSQLVKGRSPATQILQAMKLLRTYGIQGHTEERLRVVCDDVLNSSEIGRSGEVWRRALDTLMRWQFLEPRHDSRNRRQLVMRKDSYFDVVAHDLDSIERVATLSLSMVNAMYSINDSDALTALALFELSAGNYDWAVAAFEYAVATDRRNAKAWYGLGSAFAKLGKAKESTDAYDTWLNMLPDEEKQLYSERLMLGHLP